MHKYNIIQFSHPFYAYLLEDPNENFGAEVALCRLSVCVNDKSVGYFKAGCHLHIHPWWTA